MRALATECKMCRRRTRQPDGYCYQHGPADPHVYRATRIYTQDGLILRCSRANCEDEGHKTKAALGFAN